jgi:hypothetical protein
LAVKDKDGTVKCLLKGRRCVVIRVLAGGEAIWVLDHKGKDNRVANKCVEAWASKVSRLEEVVIWVLAHRSKALCKVSNKGLVVTGKCLKMDAEPQAKCLRINDNKIIFKYIKREGDSVALPFLL